MDREIKFRAWDKENKIMFDTDTSNPLIHFNGEINSFDEKGEIKGVYFTKQVKLLQYTGLKDKNGKEIYEGDIVSLFYETQISEVRFNSKYGCWEVKVQLSIHSQGWDLLGNHLGESEVIGNIYENPELLEVEEDE